MVYVDPPALTETPQTFKGHIYDTLFRLAAAGNPPVMRIVQNRPVVHWDLVWRNLQDSCAPEEVRSAWYAVIYDILPTRERLPAFNLTDTNSCGWCGETNTLQHRPTGCGEGLGICN